MKSRTLDQLSDLDAKRLAEKMDAAGIVMQLVSLNYPGTEQSDIEEAIAIARDANLALAEAVRKPPTRLVGLAAFPTGAPEQAARNSNARSSRMVSRAP